MGYVFSILFVVAMSCIIGFCVGYFVAKERFYQKGLDDEAARWKSKVKIIKGEKAQG